SNSPLKQLFLYSGWDRAKKRPPCWTSRESIANEPTSLASKAGSNARASAFIYLTAVSSFNSLSSCHQQVPAVHIPQDLRRQFSRVGCDSRSWRIRYFWFRLITQLLVNGRR